MSNNLEDYNIVAIGDSDVWRQLGCELSKIKDCSLLRIPISFNPYSVPDKYQLGAIFLLPDALQIYQGVCRAWVQRFRFGPNVNTPIVCIIDETTQRNIVDELKQLMHCNIINWILTSREITALLLFRTIHHSQVSIRRCLQMSAGQIVRHGIRRAEYLRETGGTVTVNADAPSGGMTGNAGITRYPSTNPAVIPNGGATPIRPNERIVAETSSAKVTEGKMEDHKPSKVAVLNQTATSSVASGTSQSQQSPTPSIGQRATHVQKAERQEKRKRPRGDCANQSSISAQTQTEANPNQAQMKPLLYGGVKRAKLRRKAHELNKKLDRAMIYISRVQSLLDGETSQG